MNLNEYHNSLSNYLESYEFGKLDDASKQKNIDGFRTKFIEQNPNQDPEAVNRATENLNKNFLRGTGRGRYAPSPEELNNIIFPNQEPGYDALSKDQKNEKIEEFKLTIPELAKAKPTQREDFEYFLNESTRELARRNNGEDRNKLVDLSVRATQGLVAGLARYTGFEEAAKIAEDYFHEDPEFDEDFSSYLAQGIGDVGAGMAIFIGTTLATRGLGGSAAAGMRAGTGASLASNSLMRYNEAYHNAIDLGLDADKATKAGLSAIPAAAIDVLGDRIIAGKLMPNNVNKIFSSGTFPEKKKALFDLIRDNLNRAKLFEIGRSAAAEGVTEVLGDYVASYMPYLTHGYDDYVPTDKELALSFAVGSILGGGIAIATSGIGLKKRKGAPELAIDPDGGSIDSPTPVYDNKTQMRLGETNRNIDVLDREQQTEVFNLLSSGKYKEAYQLSTGMLNTEAQPNTSPSTGPTVDVESEVETTTTNENESTANPPIVASPTSELETDVKISLGVMLDGSNLDQEHEPRNASINSNAPDRSVMHSKITHNDSNPENSQKIILDALAVKWVQQDPSRKLNDFYQKININFPVAQPTEGASDPEIVAAESSQEAATPGVLSVLDSSGILDESFSPEERTALASKLGIPEINSETIASLDNAQTKEFVEALIPSTPAPAVAPTPTPTPTPVAEAASATVTNPINPSSVAQEAARILEVMKKRVKERFKDVKPQTKIEPQTEPTTVEEFINQAINSDLAPDLVIAYRQMLDDILAKNPGVRILFGDYNFDGSFNGLENIILIGPNGTTRTFIHEVSHALTQADINTYVEMRPESTYKQKLNAAKKDKNTPDHIRMLIDVYQRAAIVMDRQSIIGQDASDLDKISAMDRQSYTFINLHEFVAEAMSNAEFQEALADIPYNGKNLWQVIVETLSQAFEWMSTFANPELIMRSNGRNSLAATMSSVNNIIYNQFTQGGLRRAEQGASILANTTPNERWNGEAEVVNNINYLPGATFSSQRDLAQAGKSGPFKALTAGKDGTVPWQAMNAKLKNYPKAEVSMITDVLTPLVTGGRINLADAISTLETLAESAVNVVRLNARKGTTNQAQREAEIEHILDTELGPEWTEWTGGLFDASTMTNNRHIELRNELEDLYNTPDQEAFENNSEAASARYTMVNPKPLSEMEDARDITVEEPVETSEEIKKLENEFNSGKIKDKDFRKFYESREKIKFQEDTHFPTRKNVIGFGRMYDETLPSGDKATFVFEVQSDWASQESKYFKQQDEELEDSIIRFEDTKGRSITAEEIEIINNQFKKKRENLIKNKLSPFLSVYENLVLKSAIHDALAKGQNHVAITDAETAMMTEQHDKYAKAKYNKEDLGKWQARDAPNKNSLSGSKFFNSREEALEALESFKNKVNPTYDLEVVQITEADTIPIISQESGMRAAYDAKDGRLHNIMRKLTKSKGELVDFGVHKNARPEMDGDFGGGLSVVDMNVPPVGSPVFKNVDGTPKSNITALVYPLDKVDKAEISSLFGGGGSVNNINYSPENHEGILYHGGTYPGGKPKASARGALGYGFYLTPNESKAKEYVNENGWGEKLSGGRLSAFSVKLKNPIRLDWTQPTDFVESMALQQVGVTQEKAEAMIEKAMEDHGFLGKEISSRGIKMGHDGIELFRNGELAEVVVWNMGDVEEAFLTFMDEVDINNINYSPDNGRRAFDPEAIKRYEGLRFKARDILIDMPIIDFLALADPLDTESRDTARKAVESGELLKEIPQLWSDDSLGGTSRITGHEGRHRARALISAGYNTMPVLWQSSRIRWSEQQDSSKSDYVDQFPSKVKSENGKLSFDYPIKRDGENNINYSPSFDEMVRQRFRDRNKPVEQFVTDPVTQRMDDLYMQEVEKVKETNDFTLLNEMVEIAANRSGLDVSNPMYRGDITRWNEFSRPSYLTPDFNFAWDMGDSNNTNIAPRKFYLRKNLRLAKVGDVVNGKTVETSSYLNQFGIQSNPWSNWAGIAVSDLKKDGYDGIQGIIDGSKVIEEVVIINGGDMKLADPITYDENMKVIPLSQRFNLASNMINYSPENQRAQRIVNSYKRFNAIIRGKVNDKSDFRTIQIIAELAGIRTTDVANLEPEMQEYFFALVDNIYNSRKSGINNPEGRIESDTVLAGVQDIKNLIEANAVKAIVETYDGLIDFSGIDITNREAVELAVNEYMQNEGLLEDTAKNSTKAAARLEKIYNKYKLKFNEIRTQAIERFADAENYLKEVQAMHGDVHEEYLSTFIKAHYTYLANVDVSDMKGKELYNHFYSINHLMDNSFMGFELTATHIGRQRDTNQRIADQAGKFRDPVMAYGRVLMTVDKINQSAELQQVQAQRLSMFNEGQAMIKEIMLPLYDSIQRTSYNRKIRMQAEWISERQKFEETLGRDMTYEDRVVMAIAGRLVQYESGKDPDSELKRNIAKERKSINNIIKSGSPDNKKEFRTKVLPIFEQMASSATTMSGFMTNLPNMMKGTMDIETGKERAALLFKAQDIFSEFDAESKIISEGFHHKPFRKIVNYITNDVISTSTPEGEYDITDALSLWEYIQHKIGINNRAGHLHERQAQLGETDYYSYNLENTINRNFERIAVDNATIGERFILKSRLKKGSQLNNIISTDNAGVYHEGRAEFLLNLGKTIVNNAFSRGEPMNILVGGLRKMTNAFARVTLSGMHHIVMQPLSAMSDYAVRTGNIKGWFDAAQAYAGNMQKFNEWFEEHYQWTAERGALETMALDVRRSPIDDDKSFMNTPAMKFLENIYEGAGKVITFSIRQGDNFSSKVTILAEYTRLLKEKGYKIKSMDDFDFETVEGLILTEATSNVELNINTSNKIQRGALFSDRRQTTTVLRNMLVAFASHQTMLATQMNQAVRDMLELKAMGATKGQLEQKVRTIGAIMIQSFVFVTGRYAIGSMMTAGMISLIKDRYDDEEGTIEALQEKLMLEQKKGDAVRIEIARNELANAQTVRSVITKMEGRSMSFGAYWKQLLKDQMGSMFIGFSSETVNKMNPVFFVADAYQQSVHTQSMEEISKDYQERIRAAKKRGAVKEVASLTEKLTMLEAAEYIPFNYPDTGGVGIGGLYGPTLDAFMMHGSELTKGALGLQEVNYNDFILAAAVVGLGQADARKFLNAVDKIEDQQWKRNRNHEESKIPAAELRKREALKKKRQQLLSALD